MNEAEAAQAKTKISSSAGCGDAVTGVVAGVVDDRRDDVYAAESADPVMDTSAGCSSSPLVELLGEHEVLYSGGARWGEAPSAPQDLLWSRARKRGFLASLRAAELQTYAFT